MGDARARQDANPGGGGHGSSGQQMVPLGVSAGISDGTSDLLKDYRDLNGDGLPDRVVQNGDQLQVALNLGYRFAPFEPWGRAHLNKGKTKVKISAAPSGTTTATTASAAG